MNLFESLVGNIGIGINQDLVKLTQWVLEQGWKPKSVSDDDGAMRYEFSGRNTKWKFGEAYNEVQYFCYQMTGKFYCDTHNLDSRVRVSIFDSKEIPFTFELQGTMNAKPSLTIVTYDQRSALYLDKIFEKVK